MSDHQQSGGCLCGAVRFRTTASPVRALACHCTTCKQRTGAAYGVGVYFKDEAVEWLQGTTNTYELHSDTSGRWIRNEFCPHCGTQISFTATYLPGLIDISVGSLDDPESVKPEFHYWHSKHLSWAEFADELPRHAEFPPLEQENN